MSYGQASRCASVTQTTLLQLKSHALRSVYWHNYVFSPAEVYAFSVSWNWGCVVNIFVDQVNSLVSFLCAIKEVTGMEKADILCPSRCRWSSGPGWWRLTLTSDNVKHKCDRAAPPVSFRCRGRRVWGQLCLMNIKHAQLQDCWRKWVSSAWPAGEYPGRRQFSCLRTFRVFGMHDLRTDSLRLNVQILSHRRGFSRKHLVDSSVKSTDKDH